MSLIVRVIAALVVPISAMLGQSIQPYAHAGTGFGFMKYEGGRTSTFEAGAILKGYVALAVDRMHFAQGAESGTWTLAQLRAYPFRLRKYGGFWIAGGLGLASADGRESESAQWHMLYRFSGLGSKAAMGGDLALGTHVFVTPAIAVRRTVGSAESSMCTHPYDMYGNFAPTTCGAWTSSSYPFQAVEISISLSLR